MASKNEVVLLLEGEGETRGIKSKRDAVEKLGPVIYREIWDRSGEYRARRYYGEDQSYVSMKYDGSYYVITLTNAAESRGGFIQVFEPIFKKAVETFFAIWGHIPYHGTLRF